MCMIIDKNIEYMEGNILDILSEYTINLSKLLAKYDGNEHKGKIYKLSENDVELLDEYVKKCLKICWEMVLSRPILEFYPNKFLQDGMVYDAKIHQKHHTSDKKCSNVLYVIWPMFKRKKMLVEEMKMKVFLKEFEIFKIKKSFVHDNAPDVVAD